MSFGIRPAEPADTGAIRRIHLSAFPTAIEAAKAIARATGEELIFVLGEPDYYRRFGFSAETARPFTSAYSGPYFMALALKPGFTPPKLGRADYAPAFATVGDER